MTLFCGEHGTLDYCPLCAEEDREDLQAARIAELEAENARLQALIQDLQNIAAFGETDAGDAQGCCEMIMTKTSLYFGGKTEKDGERNG